MSSTLKAIKLGALLLAGSTMFGAQDAAAQSCTAAAWDSTAGTAAAGSPASSPAVKRYSGACGLSASASGSYVVESTNHSAEGNATPFSARFYVFTGVTGGNPTIFEALSGENAGAQAISIAYDPTEQNFDFTVNGSTRSTAASSAPRNRWVGVEFSYQANQPFSAATRSGGVTTSLGSPQTAGAAFVESVRLGMINANGATGTLYFDEYEASRAAGSTPPSPVCLGDSNNDGSINIFDAVGALNERVNGTLSAGQPDCNEDGTINVFDAVCVLNLRLGGATCN